MCQSAKILPEDGLLIYITLGPRRSWLWEDVSQAPFSLCIGSKPHGLSITDENSGGTVARLASRRRTPVSSPG